jgi:hypothetical protein
MLAMAITHAGRCVGRQVFALLLTRSRLVGGVAAMGYVALYAVLLTTLYGTQGVAWVTYSIGAYLISLAFIAAWSLLTLKPLPLLAAFFGSFLSPPVGLYFLLLGGYIRWAGVCNLL